MREELVLKSQGWRNRRVAVYGIVQGVGQVVGGAVDVVTSCPRWVRVPLITLLALPAALAAICAVLLPLSVGAWITGAVHGRWSWPASVPTAWGLLFVVGWVLQAAREGEEIVTGRPVPRL